MLSETPEGIQIKCFVLLSKFYLITPTNISKLVNAPNVYNFMKIISPFSRIITCIK
jgi:hypothetical protein